MYSVVNSDKQYMNIDSCLLKKLKRVRGKKKEEEKNAKHKGSVWIELIFAETEN